MRRYGAALIALCCIAGCATTRHAAPVREAATQRQAAPTPRPQVATEPVRPGYYRVQPGDTLYKIAFDHGLDFRDLAEWNDLDDPERIFVGRALRLSEPSRPRPAPQKTAAAPAASGPAAPAPRPASPPRQSAETAADRPAAKPPEKPLPTPVVDPEAPPERWVWPARGSVVTAFNEPPGSKGMDLAGTRGSPVLAAAPGRVVYAGLGLRGYGKLIIIRHGKTLLSAYGHQDQMLVREGQVVALGQPIGTMGDTDADRVKLHFEIREYGKPVDPMKYLPKQG